MRTVVFSEESIFEWQRSVVIQRGAVDLHTGCHWAFLDRVVDAISLMTLSSTCQVNRAQVGRIDETNPFQALFVEESITIYWVG